MRYNNRYDQRYKTDDDNVNIDIVVIFTMKSVILIIIKMAIIVEVVVNTHKN